MTRLLRPRTLPLRWFAMLAPLGFAAARCTAAINERHPSREELTVSHRSGTRSCPTGADRTAWALGVLAGSGSRNRVRGGHDHFLADQRVRQLVRVPRARLPHRDRVVDRLRSRGHRPPDGLPRRCNAATHGPAPDAGLGRVGLARDHTYSVDITPMDARPLPSSRTRSPNRG